MSRKFAITVGALFGLTVLVVVFEVGRRQSWATSETPSVDHRDSVPGRTQPSGVTPSEFGLNPTIEPFPSLPADPSHPVVRFEHADSGKGVRAMVLAGAPGIWPPETLRSDERGILYLPNTDVRTLRGEMFKQFELLARSSSGSHAVWKTVSFDTERGEAEDVEPTAIELDAASSVEVTVRDASGDVQSGANVRLSRGALGFVTLNKHADPDGRAWFRTIPEGTYLASAQQSDVGRGEVQFRHDANDVATIEIELTEEAVSTPSPTSSNPSSDASGPRRVDVLLRGLGANRWRETQLRWRAKGEAWKLATLRPAEQPGARRWRRRVRTGAVEAEIRTEDGSADRRTFSLEPGNNAYTWDVGLQSQYDVYTVDAYGAPVEGALIQVWKGDEKVASRVSRGSEPVTFFLDQGVPVRFFAADGRRGETTRRVDPGAGADGELTLKLDAPLFSGDFPPDRVRGRDRIREILGVPILRDGDSWRVDGSDPGAAGIDAGLRRGDRLVSLRDVPEGWSVLYQRDAQIRALAIGSGD